MSDQPDLTVLSIKDLRQLAGEHQIHNRSRLGKDDLIQALQGVLSGHLAATTAKASASASTQIASENVVADKAVPEKIAVEKAAVVPKAKEPVAHKPVEVASEPELLDAAAVAELTVAETTAAPMRVASPAPGESVEKSETAETGVPGERHRRRRRRGRGRGRGRRENGEQAVGNAVVEDDDADDGESDSDSSNDVDAVAAPHPTNPVAPMAKAPAAPIAPAAPTISTNAPVPPRSAPAAHAHAPSAPRPPQPVRDQQAPRDQQTPRGDAQRRPEPAPRPAVPPQDARGPRPRVDGPQRPLPSVLDRLCSFSKGILELCDPSTPTWAQARLSELLAEIGVGPTPCTGMPNAEFHQIIGTIVAQNIPLGHIAVVEAPGFVMRGDRGDLFSLRKAQIRVAASERSDIAPASVAAVRPISTPVAPVRAPAPTPIPNNSQTVAPTAAVVAPAAAPATPAGLEGVTPKPNPVREPRPPRPVRAPDAGRSPLRTHGMEPVGEAPALPLAQQDPAELAQKPKAAGFMSLGLNDQILADLAAIGYSEPTPIQSESIPVVLAGKDILGQAQTGTGKTAAFVLPILQKLYSCESPERKPIALILCPTRELARQVFTEFTKMAGASGARAVVIYGGTPMEDQIRALERFPHVIIGTPGRIIDHMKRRALDLSGLQNLVLDEADQMLDIGFWPDVNYIMSHTPPNRQVMLFSATFPEEVKDMAQKHMKDPQSIRITPKLITVEQVDQKFIAVSRDRKNSLLAHFIETQNPPQLVVFCRTKHQTDRVAEVLKRKNMSAGAIHGDLPQSKRERILAQFRSGEIQSLIATNVAARGLDIPTVSHVVNYDIPEMPEEYVHRIGRTARNGAKGVARTFITPEDGQFLLEIEKHIGLLLEEEKIEGFEATPAEPEVKRTIADMPVGQPRMLKPLVGGIKLGRRRR